MGCDERLTVLFHVLDLSRNVLQITQGIANVEAAFAKLPSTNLQSDCSKSSSDGFQVSQYGKQAFCYKGWVVRFFIMFRGRLFNNKFQSTVEFSAVLGYRKEITLLSYHLLCFLSKNLIEEMLS